MAHLELAVGGVESHRLRREREVLASACEGRRLLTAHHGRLGDLWELGTLPRVRRTWLKLLVRGQESSGALLFPSPSSLSLRQGELCRQLHDCASDDQPTQRSSPQQSPPTAAPSLAPPPLLHAVEPSGTSASSQPSAQESLACSFGSVQRALDLRWEKESDLRSRFLS